MADMLLITTGGTIDKVYFDAASSFQVGESVAIDILRTAQVTTLPRVVEIMRKDSLELTDADRGRICLEVASAQERCIVITHGTDTIVDTAAALANVAPDKTVILVGALTPARFAKSDAVFNLGMAVAAAQLAPPGVHVAMNGSIFPSAAVRKDRALGRFVAA